MLKKGETISSKQRSGILVLLIFLSLTMQSGFYAIFEISNFDFFKTSCVLVIIIYYEKKVADIVSSTRVNPLVHNGSRKMVAENSDFMTRNNIIELNYTILRSVLTLFVIDCT